MIAAVDIAQGFWMNKLPGIANTATVGATHIKLHICLFRNILVMSLSLCPLFIIQSMEDTLCIYQ